MLTAMVIRMRGWLPISMLFALSCASTQEPPTALATEPAEPASPGAVPVASRASSPPPASKPDVAVAPEAPAPKRTKPCRHRMKPAPEKEQLAAIAQARSTRGAGTATGSKGFYQAVVPRGFKRNDRAQQYDQMEINKGRVHGFVHDTEPYVFVEVRRRPSVKIAKSAALRAWAEAVIWQREPLAKHAVNSAAVFIDHVPVYFAVWRDKQGRRNIEYAYVPKGCERGEVYVRFVEHGRALMQITVDVNGTAAPTLAAPWLDAFFDAPLASKAPAERRFAYGQRHNL